VTVGNDANCFDRQQGHDNMKINLPDCFGNQAGSMLDGRTPEKCIDCEWFEKCHKITVAASLLSISDALDLIIPADVDVNLNLLVERRRQAVWC
jgi:hypothetical protein